MLIVNMNTREYTCASPDEEGSIVNREVHVIVAPDVCESLWYQGIKLRCLGEEPSVQFA
jgi:hypothetical protein